MNAISSFVIECVTKFSIQHTITNACIHKSNNFIHNICSFEFGAMIGEVISILFYILT